MSQPSDCFFLNLANSFTGKTEFFTNLFKCHLLATYTEEESDYVPFPFSKSGKRPVDLS